MTEFLLPGGFSLPVQPATKQQTPQPRAPLPRNRLASAALICVGLFFVSLVIAIALHPNIPGVLMIAVPVFPVAAIVLGIASRPKSHKAGRRLGTIAITFGIVLAVIVLGASILLPSMCRPRESSLVAKCQSQMSNIYAYIETYKTAHGGNYPPSLDALITDPAVNMPAYILVCPSSNDSTATGASVEEIVQNLHHETFHQSYEYIAPTMQSPANDTPLVYEHPHNHRHSHMHVLFASGEVRMLTMNEAKAVIPALANYEDSRTD